MKKTTFTRSALVIALSASLMLTAACENYRAASPETTVPETTVVETTGETKPSEAATVTANPTPAETTVEKIPVEPIDTSIRTDLPAPALYTVTGKTATGKTTVWQDASRETASRYLVAGDTVTAVAIVGSEARPYALLDSGEYVLLESLEAVPVATATPAPSATPKPTKAPVKETTAPATTTAAPTDPPPAATTAAPAYVENPDNIKALVIQKLIDKGLWFPDATVIGDGSMGWTLGYKPSDERYAKAFVNAKFNDKTNYGATSVNVWIADGYIYISCTTCALPEA